MHWNLPLREGAARSPRRWLPTAGVLLVLALSLGVAVPIGSGRLIGPRVVAAPNQGRTLQALGEPTAAELASHGADYHLRVRVGPPEASLALWVFEPRGGAIRVNFADRFVYAFNQEDRPQRDVGQPLGTILVLHGIHDRTEGYNGAWGRIFAAAGYRAVLVDLRGHGRSTGDWLTYGVVESRDIRQVIDHLEARQLVAGRLGLFGISYGGAVAIQAAALDPRIDAVSSVAAFSSLADVVPPFGRRLVERRFGRPAWMALRHTVPQVLRGAGRAGSFDPAEASPLRAIGRIRSPVQIIHGTADSLVPHQHALALHAAAGRGSELVLLQPATHVSVPLQRLGELRGLALEFFDRTLPAAPLIFAGTEPEDAPL